MCSDSVSQLLDLIQLERLDAHRFLGRNWDIGNRSIFGGQVIGQGLSAAQQTLDETRAAHSLHAYFLRAGDLNAPVHYQVEPTRNGKSFATRRVEALQHGRPILQMAVSFQIEEDGVQHQAAMPKLSAPEQLAEPMPAGIDIEALPRARRLQWLFGADSPFEFRFLDPSDPIVCRFQPLQREPKMQAWLRLREPIAANQALHRALLAYVSDFNLLETASRPHGLSALHGRRLHITSLDHALWFHRPFRIDEWLLCDYDSPSASGARGFNRGQIFSRDGRLVASSAQEGLIRLHPEPPPA